MKWFKNNRFNIFTYLFCAFSMALLFIVSFSCKTYAYSIDNNGNLVGDNILDMSSYEILERNNVELIEYDNGSMIISVNSQSSYSYIVFHFLNTSLEINTQYTFSYNANSTDYTHYNNISLKYANTGAAEDNYYWRQHLYENRNYYSTFNSESHTDLYLLIYVNANIGGNNTITLSNIMLNKGEFKEWEPYGVWYSEVNYYTLENQYNDLNNTYQRVLQENQYGFFNYVGSVLFIYTDYDSIRQVRLTRDTLINQGILLNGGIFNPNAIVESDLIQGAINFSFDLETGAPWEVINFYLMENDNYVVNIQIEDDEENTINLIKSHSNDILDNYVTPNEIYTKFLETGVNNLDVILRISFNFQSFDTSARVVSANNGSYNLGYEDGAQFYKSNYNIALRQINLDNTQINNLKQELTLLQSAYNDLNQSYHNSLNGNNFANLFFTIAETPFASFKQIWSVDFLGVNLAGFVTGILFIGVLIWVVKKIF